MIHRLAQIGLVSVIGLMVAWATPASAQRAAADAATVTVRHFSPASSEMSTVTAAPKLSPVLTSCLFAEGDAARELTDRGFAQRCVVPYIIGLWTDPTVLYRSKADIARQAEDRLIEHPSGDPFPIFYPPRLDAEVKAELSTSLSSSANIVLKPLPDPLPAPSRSAESLYNNIGLLYLPNPYVVPGDTFNEMYGWDSYFIIEGLLASVDYIFANPQTPVWDVESGSFKRLTLTPGDPLYYRTFAEHLFRTAKGMVDNHIFEINFYGGFVLNANRTYYLTRSQPPLFAREALAVWQSARKYGFAYEDTLTPYLAALDTGASAPTSFEDWIGAQVLPAARKYYAYWTDPGWSHPAQEGAAGQSNPRVAMVEFEGAQHPVYLYGTAGVGPVPEVARSTQPQNRKLYDQAAKVFEAHPDKTTAAMFYAPDDLCTADAPSDTCGDRTYNLTQTYYAADRAIRASGFDLSKRFGEAGEWAMHYAPISLNVLVHQMARDIDRLAEAIGEPDRTQTASPGREAFLAKFFATGEPGAYADRFIGENRPDDVPEFTYPYGTQLYLLSAGLLSGSDASALIQKMTEAEPSLAFLTAPAAAQRQYGIPTSLKNTGAQWDAPFAWAPVQYFAVDGLIAEGFPLQATETMMQWVAAANAFFAKTGVLIEKYDVEDPANDPRAKVGYAQAQRGFGWTNGVYILFANRLFLPL